MSNTPCPRCYGTVERGLQIMPDSLCATCQINEIKPELISLRAKVAELEGEIEKAFKAGQNSIGWRDEEMSRIDETWEGYKAKRGL